MKQKFVIATSNSHKVEEFQNILKPFDIKVVPYKDVLKEEIEIIENGKTFKDNAKIKAELIAEKTGLPVIADDSGFCIKNLDGFPGVISSRFADEIGSYDLAFEEIQKRLNNKISEAKFVCVIAFAVKGKKTEFFEGICNGFIIFPKRGENGFGYDSIFVPNSYGKTFAEMEIDEKNQISHRAFASSLFIKYLEKLKKDEEENKKTPKQSKEKDEDIKEVKSKKKAQEKVEIKAEEKIVDENSFDIDVDLKFEK